MKQEFFNYLGAPNSLSGYVRSYKLVFYKCLFNLMSNDGILNFKTLCIAFRDYYLNRKKSGKIPDKDVSSAIGNIETSDLNSIAKVILENPFEYIKRNGFVFMKKDDDGNDEICLNQTLIKELNHTDIETIKTIVDQKLDFYFSKIDGTVNSDFYLYMKKFANEYLKAKREPFTKNPMGDLLRHQIPDAAYKTGFIPKEKYYVKGSIGQGGWANVPWVCIFDRNITTTAENGEYIVYLLSNDGESLYLTFNQGFTELNNTYSKREVSEILSKKISEIRNSIDSHGFNADNNIQLKDGVNSRADFYEKGTIFYKQYHCNSFPSQDVFISDLNKMLDIYREYANLSKGKTLEDQNKTETKRAWLITWNPNNWDWEDLQDGINYLTSGKGYFSSWSCMNTKVQEGDRVFLIILGQGDRNGIMASGYATSESYKDAHWNEEKASFGETTSYIDIEFDKLLNPNTSKILSQQKLKDEIPNQNWSPFASGIEIKSENIEKLEELWSKYSMGGEEEMSVKEIISDITNYISAKGFYYEDSLIENFYLSLKSKPFVILAGTSGTGKTRLVKLFAEAIGATSENGRYKLVPVRPDWSDSTDLFGHVDLNGRFVPGKILDFIKQAESDINNPYFLCLDEMNLARVEYYLSDILSIIETRDLQPDGTIKSEPLIDSTYYGSDEDAFDTYGNLSLPENLYIVGTVNMDETTFPFSRKVLDRANTIEFSYVDLLAQEVNDFLEDTEVIKQSNDFLKTKYLMLSQCSEYSDETTKICTELQQINNILKTANSHVGYRVRDEIVFYMLNNLESDLMPRDDAMDYEIMQKILPRIQGSSASTKNMLCQLFKLCAGDYEGFQTENNDIASKMERKAESDCKYKKSAKKIAFMVRRYEEDGFTSYWL